VLAERLFFLVLGPFQQFFFFDPLWHPVTSSAFFIGVRWLLFIAPFFWVLTYSGHGALLLRFLPVPFRSELTLGVPYSPSVTPPELPRTCVYFFAHRSLPPGGTDRTPFQRGCSLPSRFVRILTEGFPLLLTATRHYRISHPTTLAEISLTVPSNIVVLVTVKAHFQFYAFFFLIGGLSQNQSVYILFVGFFLGFSIRPSLQFAFIFRKVFSCAGSQRQRVHLPTHLAFSLFSSLLFPLFSFCCGISDKGMSTSLRYSLARDMCRIPHSSFLV